MLKHCLDRYKTQEMCDKAVSDFLPTLNSVPDCFIIIKMLDKLDNVVFFNGGIGLDDIDSDFVPFFSDDMDLNTINLNNIKLMIIILMNMILKLSFMLGLWLTVIDINKASCIKMEISK